MKTQKYRVEHSLIIGKPGAGKTTLISEMLQTVKTKSPEVKVFVIDVKNDRSDVDAYDRADFRVTRQCRITDTESVVEFVVTALEEFIRFSERNKEVLLVVEELDYITQCFNRSSSRFYFSSSVEKIIACGNSQGARIWMSCFSDLCASNILSPSTRSVIRKFTI